MNLKDFTKALIKDTEFAREYATPDASELRILRKMKHLTQEQVARRAGTKQSAISRIERNDEETTLGFVGRIAYALGYKAKLVFVKLEQ